MSVIVVSPKHSFVAEGTRISTYHANTGEGLPQHNHAFSHVTQCDAGRLVIRKEGKQLEMTKDTQPVNLVAGEWHEIEALEDGTVFFNVFVDGKY